jgi:hypothetical protein
LKRGNGERILQRITFQRIMKSEVRDFVKLPSQTVYMEPGNREQLLSLAYALRQADLHLIAPESLGVPLLVERQSVDVAELEERQQGDLPYWVGPAQFADR